MLFRHTVPHVRLDRAGINRIHGPTRGKFSRPSPGHGIQRRFGPSIHRLADKALGGRYRGDVDDPRAPVVGKMFQRSLHQQDRTEDVDSVHPFKLLDGDLFEMCVDGNAGVVDDDVDLECLALLVVVVGEFMLFHGLDQ